MNPAERLVYFIHERYRIWVRRTEYSWPKPWTEDPILLKYRFCNVFREHDTVTKWVDQHWRFPNQFDPDVWFAMVVARMINWPPTLKAIGYPVPWKPKQFYKKAAAAHLASNKVFSSAYMVRSSARPKIEYLVEEVFNPMWLYRKSIRPDVYKNGARWFSEPLWDIYGRLVQCKGMGSFMAAQIIADIKYTPPLMAAEDWHTFAASGPGSRRGLNRALQRLVDAPWKEHEWKRELVNLKDQVEPLLKRAGESQVLTKGERRLIMPRMHAQDFQNCLCEFDKYERVRLGEGTPRQLYNGGK